MADIVDNSFVYLQQFLRDQTGIVIEQERSYLLETRLARLLVEYKCRDFADLYSKIRSGINRELITKVINAMTTNETQWFRAGAPWHILEDVMMPQWVEQLRKGEKLRVRIWSAACSTGQEPYSIAMLIDDYLKNHNVDDVCLDNFEITATDISTAVLALAKNGRYESIAIARGLPDYFKKKYFVQSGRVWQLKDELLRFVYFSQLNLQNDFSQLSIFDAIFLRNVLIYFDETLKISILKRMVQSLSNDGVLFLGNAEMMPEQNFYKQICSNGDVYFSLKEKT